MSLETSNVVTIDGPSGTGKGTISVMVAKRLGWHFLDSGALYRVLALYAMKKGVELEDEPSLSQLAVELPVRFESENPSEPAKIFLEQEVVTDQIRTEQSGNAASKVAAFGQVREALLGRQKAFLKAPGLVADGRDMGTIVFPNAILKIFLDATAEERAKRRFNQLKEKGVDVTLQGLIGEIAQRDARDKQRAVAPLRPADDAIIIDTTKYSINEVFNKVIQEVEQKVC